MKVPLHPSKFRPFAGKLFLLIYILSAINSSGWAEAGRKLDSNVVAAFKSSIEKKAEATIERLILNTSTRRGDTFKIKRQVDSNTVFVGLRIIQGLIAQDYRRVKVTARRVERSVRRLLNLRFRRDAAVGEGIITDQVDRVLGLPPLNSLFGGRRKRPYDEQHPLSTSTPSTLQVYEHHQHHHIVPIYIPVATQQESLRSPAVATTTTPVKASVIQQNITVTQGIFQLINFNISLATRLREEFLRDTTSAFVSTDENISSDRIRANQLLIVVNHSGVTCEDVCDTEEMTSKDGKSFGTIGICTPSFCQCDFKRRRFTRRNCTDDAVFDPVLRACNDPRDVILCNDDFMEEAEPTKGDSGGYAAADGGAKGKQSTKGVQEIDEDGRSSVIGKGFGGSKGGAAKGGTSGVNTGSPPAGSNSLSSGTLPLSTSSFNLPDGGANLVSSNPGRFKLDANHGTSSLGPQSVHLNPTNLNSITPAMATAILKLIQAALARNNHPNPVGAPPPAYNTPVGLPSGPVSFPPQSYGQLRPPSTFYAQPNNLPDDHFGLSQFTPAQLQTLATMMVQRALAKQPGFANWSPKPTVGTLSPSFGNLPPPEFAYVPPQPPVAPAIVTQIANHKNHYYNPPPPLPAVPSQNNNHYFNPALQPPAAPALQNDNYNTNNNDNYALPSPIDNFNSVNTYNNYGQAPLNENNNNYYYNPELQPPAAPAFQNDNYNTIYDNNNYALPPPNHNFNNVNTYNNYGQAPYNENNFNNNDYYGPPSQPSNSAASLKIENNNNYEKNDNFYVPSLAGSQYEAVSKAQELFSYSVSVPADEKVPESRTPRGYLQGPEQGTRISAQRQSYNSAGSQRDSAGANQQQGPPGGPGQYGPSGTNKQNQFGSVGIGQHQGQAGGPYGSVRSGQQGQAARSQYGLPGAHQQQTSAPGGQYSPVEANQQVVSTPGGQYGPVGTSQQQTAVPGTQLFTVETNQQQGPAGGQHGSVAATQQQASGSTAYDQYGPLGSSQQQPVLPNSVVLTNNVPKQAVGYLSQHQIQHLTELAKQFSVHNAMTQPIYAFVQ